MHCVRPISSRIRVNLEEDLTPAQIALYYLFFNRELSFSDLSKNVLSAIFGFKDQALLDDAFVAFQAVLDQVEITPDTEHLDEVMIGNFLALLPFFGPTPGKTISIPQKKVDGTWPRVGYSIEPIDLTPESFGSPFQCYGLTSAFDTPPILLFRGTSHPTCSGACWSYWTDFVPFTTPGESLYRLFVREKVAEWLERNPGARVYGQSLGGSLALMTACEHPDAISEVHAYGAPIPFARFLNTYDERKNSVSPPKISLYQN